MFLPLKDDNPLKIIPYQYATIGIIGLCALTFLWQLSLTSADAERAIGGLAVVPAALLGGRTDLSLVPPTATLVTSLFLHGGWLHLISNMLYLWVFGDNIEDAMGHGRFVAFFLVCGAVGGLAHAIVNADSTIPTIGASGAVSGVLGAYLLLHPRVRVLVLVFKWFPIRLPAYVVLGGWIILQVIPVLRGSGAGSDVAWWAHIAGFGAGVALIAPMRRKTLPLLDRGPDARPGPWDR